MEGEEVNIQELAANLSTYEDQLQQVRKLLNDDPKNSEFLDMEKELAEVCYVVMASLFSLVIELTEELLETAKQNDGSSELVTGTSGEASPDLQLSGRTFDNPTATAINGIKFPIGIKVQAVWSEDGEWYDATIEAHTANGYYVSYEGWGNKEEVDPDNVRPIQEGTADPLLEAEKIAVATKEALKQKIVQSASKEFEAWTIPAKLHIDPNDSEDVKAAKRKKIHAFKSKMRMEAKEVTQNKRQNAWQQFQTTKGKAKK
ncbi:survival of motor neuron-related-splicing factor 30-like isoform X8 [Salvia hispanica]|nr:survival of motor neuron-related-splicing factor 30-like isoform X8 [Salvia hispanica]